MLNDESRHNRTRYVKDQAPPTSDHHPLLSGFNINYYPLILHMEVRVNRIVMVATRYNVNDMFIRTKSYIGSKDNTISY